MKGGKELRANKKGGNHERDGPYFKRKKNQEVLVQFKTHGGSVEMAQDFSGGGEKGKGMRLLSRWEKKGRKAPYRKKGFSLGLVKRSGGSGFRPNFRLSRTPGVGTTKGVLWLVKEEGIKGAWSMETNMEMDRDVKREGETSSWAGVLQGYGGRRRKGPRVGIFGQHWPRLL